MDLSILERLKLWQMLLVFSVMLGTLGFTGADLFGSAIIEGKENYAIVGFFVLLGFSILLRYIPPPAARARQRPQITISATQTALCSRIIEWTNFETAAELNTPDDDLKVRDLRLKNTALRLELGTAQGLLMRRVNETGEHEVKYRYTDDATMFEPQP